MAGILNFDEALKSAFLTAASGVGIGSDPARGVTVLVTQLDYSGLTKTLLDFSFATDAPVPINETPIEIDHYDYANNTDLQQSQTVGSTKTTVASLQLTVTNGFQSTMGSSFNIGFPGYGGASVSFNTQTSFSTADQQSSSLTQTWNCSTPILIPAREGIRLMWSVITAEYLVPFSGTVRIAGSVSAMLGVWNTGPAFINPLGLPMPARPVGQLFLQAPQPGVTVIDVNTIEINVSGLTNTTNGIDLKTDNEQYDLSPEKKVLVQRTSFGFKPAVLRLSRKG